ncbi:MAG TPA: response regulator [Bacteroidota bacterium]|nr:response regulator [Bacteroidota bacterium]
MVEYRQSPSGLRTSTVYRKPLNVGLVAKICRVSKKTVLNWIYKDALKAFTTFGGHYRVWPGDLKKFLGKAGLDVPFQFVDDRQVSFLIIDDDPAYKMLLKEAILTRFQDADVICTDDGYEALLLIGERKPTVVMLDLRMPKVDGYQVLELLRTRKKDNLMKVVVLSAYIDAEAQERLANSVADEVWEKRKEISELLDSLQNMLESPKQARVSATILRSRNVRNHATHAV